jgi:EKC/KEOPS complex subunit PCC1/LAGE3
MQYRELDQPDRTENLPWRCLLSRTDCIRMFFSSKFTLFRFLSVPFPTPLLASQACQILSTDKELKEDLVRRVLSVEGNELRVEFECASARMTRVAVNSFLESVELVVSSMAELGELV